jgi:hypothetical protein
LEENLEESLEELVASKIHGQELELHLRMLENLRRLKSPTPVDLLLVYEEAVCQLTLTRSGVKSPSPDSLSYYMARNSYFLVPDEPAILRVHRVSREDYPVRYLFCLEIESRRSLGMYPRPGLQSKTKISEWNILSNGSKSLIGPNSWADQT